MKYSINIDQKEYEVEVGAISGGVAQVTVNGASYEVQFEKQAGQADVPVVKAAVPKPVAAPKPKAPAAPVVSGAGVIKAPIPGLIKEITVRAGDVVKNGQVVVIMEAMKMENRLISTVDGTVQDIRVHAGGQVATNDVIMVIG